MFNNNQQPFQGQQQTPTSSKNSEIQPKQFPFSQQNQIQQGQSLNSNQQTALQQGQQITGNSKSLITPTSQNSQFQVQPPQQIYPNPQIQQVVQAPSNLNNQSNMSDQQIKQPLQIKSLVVPPMQFPNLQTNINQIPRLDFIQGQGNQNIEQIQKKQQLNELEKKFQNLSSQKDQFDQKINSLNQQKKKCQVYIQKLRDKIEEEEKKRNNLSLQLENEQKKLDSELQELQNEFDKIQVERNELQTQLGMEDQKINQLIQEFRDSKRNTNIDQNKQLQSKIEQLESENRKLKEELEVQQENQLNNQTKDNEIQKISEIIERKKKYLQQIQTEIQSVNDDIEQHESHIQQRDQNINQMSFDLKQEEKKLKNLVQQVDSMKEEIKLNDDRIRLKTEQIQQLEQKTLSALRNSALVQQISNLKKDVEHQGLIYDQEIKRKQGDLTNSKIMMGNNKKEQKQFEESQRLLRIRQGKELQMKFKDSFGQLEVCFLIDSTASMEPYKFQAQQCVKGSVKAIKDLTQRDANWSTVCYVDTDILQRLGGMYKQFGFTRDSDELENFIQSVQCIANRDLPEDVEGGMKQMLNNIPWQTKFKLVILICDCPCHGTKYHNYGRNGDYQPDSDITPTIENMIQQEIFFIGIIFTNETVKMYEEIRKIYQRNNKEEYFILSDLRQVPRDQQFQKLTEVLSFASQQATQTNVRTTRTNNQTNVIKQTKNQKDNSEDYSSVEALCKVNLQQGLNADNAIRETYKVFRLQMKEESFQAKIKMIQNIGIDDFQLIEENDWDCLRSKDAFAKGAMKAAFLMTKSKFMNSKNEFYVCKTPLNMQPYPNRESALKECVLHLVSQKWLKKFYKELDGVTEQIRKQIPQLSYSDILLLQDANNKYWLAERFFEGTFVKYNNNWGFVNRSTDDVNKIAQCFSYYTYFKSDYQYMICDIQGVNACLTDPAVCTKNNYKIDPTDTGEEGIGRNIVSFGAVKNMCTNILNALKIEL